MQFEYSVFWLLIIGIISVGAGVFLYRQDKSMKNAPRIVRNLLIAFRTVLLFSLGLLLLKPFIKSEVSEVQKPIFLCLHDNSRSILSASTDTAFLKNEYAEAYNALCGRIGQSYEVDQLVFDNTVRKYDSLDFSGSETDYSKLFSTLQELYSDVNVGGIVLATDGNHTRGEALLYAARRFQTAAPIYSIVLGDSVKKTDIRIADVQFNEHAYLNKTSQIVADIQWDGVRQQNLQLKLWANDSLIASRDLILRGQSGQLNEMLNFTPLKTGLCAMKLELSEIAEDKIVENNSRQFYITVLASKKKIAFLSKGVSPDAGAFYRALKGNGNYELEYIRTLSESYAQKCDLLVFIGSDTDGSVGRFADGNAKPLLWIRGNANIRPERYTSSIAIEGSGQSSNSVSLVRNQSFSAFSVPQQLEELSRGAMPIIVPFGEYAVRGSRTQVVAYQRIKSVETQYPLITVSHVDRSKQVHLLGSGYWQWRMHCFISRGDFYVFDNFANTLAEYLLANSGEKRFTVRHPAVVSESEPLRFVAQVMDQSMQLTVQAGVTLALRNDAGFSSSYEFTPGSQSYDLLVGNLPPGVYQYDAKAQLSSEILTYSGVVQVTESNEELLFSSADTSAVAMLYDEHRGGVYAPGSFDRIIEQIESDPAKSVYVSTTEFVELIDLYWVFVFLIVLLVAEWVLRKYFGGF